MDLISLAGLKNQQSNLLEFNSFNRQSQERRSKFLTISEVNGLSLQDGDVFNILDNSAAAINTVQLEGEFKFPGIYTLENGDTILDLINKAGGITRNAYTEGAVFTRKSIAKIEKEKLSDLIPKIESELKILLIPKDESDEKNAIIEIRAGTGGEEAALFAADLFRMYNRYSELHNWKCEVMDISETDHDGIKEVIINISGKNVFGRLKYESGTHRVQRVPETESGGRIHTSAATVAVLPEATDIDVEINEKDLRIDIFRSSGPGGQSVNTTDSAVRITHIPSGVISQCQDEKSQHKNKAKAMTVLRSRIFEAERVRKEKERATERKNQVGSGDRSERIRTYNFPQGRVTDHRISLTLYKLENIIKGESLDEIINALSSDENTKKLSSFE